MSLFNGEFRRGRVVNLGGSNASVSKSSILQKAQNQREKRKQFKRQENASKVLQKHIRAYQDLQTCKKDVCDQWLNASILLTDMNQIVYQFVFIYNYSVRSPHEHLRRLLRLSEILAGQNAIYQLKPGIPKLCFNTLSDSFVTCYSRKCDKNGTSIYHKIGSAITGLLCNLSQAFDVSSVNFQDLHISLLFKSYLRNLADLKYNSGRIIKIVHSLHLLDPASTMRFFCADTLIDFLSLSELRNKEFSFVLEIIKDTFRQQTKQLDFSTFTLLEKLHILGNVTEITRYINVEKKSSQGLGILINAIIVILELVSCRIVEQDGGNQDTDEVRLSQDKDINDDKSKNESKNLEGVLCVKLPTKQFRYFDYLYSKEFLYTVFSLIDESVVSPIKLSSVYASLLKLKSDYSKQVNNLFIYLYLIPNGLSSFQKIMFYKSGGSSDDSDTIIPDDTTQSDNLNELNLENNKKLIQFVLDLKEEEACQNNNIEFVSRFIPSLYCKTSSKLILRESVLSEKFFFKDLFIFLEIVSYWLVISTDSDIENLPSNEDLATIESNKTFLTKDQFVLFIRFLKKFCLLVTWNNLKITSVLNGEQNDASEKNGTNNYAGVPNRTDSNIFGKNDSLFGNSSSLFSNNESAFGNSPIGSLSAFSGAASGSPISTEELSDIQIEKFDFEADEFITVKPTPHDYTLLKSLSVRVLNQISLIDSRLSFLPKGFWLVNDKRLENTERLLPVIAEEEERKALVQDQDNGDDDDELGYNNNEALNASSYFGSTHELFAANDNTSKRTSSRKNMTQLLMRNPDIEGLIFILHNLPFFISFKNRVRVFQMLINLDRQRGEYDQEFNAMDFFSGIAQTRKNVAEVRRDHLLDDSFDAYHKLGDTFKFPLAVTFIDKYGKPEAGIDGGGITKEFLISVINDGFNNPDAELFKQNSNYQLYPNPDIYLNLKYNSEVANSPDLKKREIKKLEKIRFLGKVIGKCLYEGILVDVNFVPSFLKKWKSIGKVSTFDELSDVDPELYNGLSKLLKLDDSFFSNSDMTFAITEKLTYKVPEPQVIDIDLDSDEEYLDFPEKTKTKIVNIDLIPNGSNVAVTNTNKLNYINAVSNHKLNKSIHPQMEAFLKGLFQMIPSEWLNMFNPSELQMLVSGGEKDIDIEDLKRNTTYGGFLDTDETIKYFWECVEEMAPQERFKLIKFVTSVPRAPLLGFTDLNPNFGIRNSGYSLQRLPTAATCVNLLKLPDYRDKKVMKQKLLFVINSEAGFDLS